MDSKPLNRQLHQLLSRRFGAVAVASAGIGFHGSIRRVFDGKALRDRYEPDVAGEYYRINCPYCNDTRQRLWVNHMYGQADPANPGRRLLWLATCYNENCLNDADNFHDFENRVFGHLNRDQRGKFKVLPGITESASLKEVALPGTTIPVNALHARNPVRQYLRSRGFDPDTVATRYGVGLCVESETFPICTGRLIIPIYMHSELVGWQARYAGELAWSAARVPKYYGLPGMPKRLMLYNYDRAHAYRVAVIVEGVTDVWKIGGPAVALFGKTAHPMQRKLLAEFSAVVLALDPDAAAETDALYSSLRRVFDGRVGVVRYPADTDAGALTREDNWARIYDAAEAAGIPEDWFKWQSA